ncbi:MAG: bifunctional aconitate hydratase 2/2-methylisocitrate dehydratase [Candidatus Aminicenantaceae bacterium]
MFESYFEKKKKRTEMEIPPLPLNPEETEELCRILENIDEKEKNIYLDIFKNRIMPGVDPSAKIKAEWLYNIIEGKKTSTAVSKKDAVFILGTMLGGYNIDPLFQCLEDSQLAQEAVKALEHIILVYNRFDVIRDMAKENGYAREVLSAWANGNWFLNKGELPEKLTLKIVKIDGEINTDDLSPAKHAWSRPDIPLHALSMGESRFPEGIETIKKHREQNVQVAFVADVLGTGSSRKSAANSLMWHIGKDIPYFPNKRRGGVVIAGIIAPIFFNTWEDSGGLPIMSDVTKLKTGDIIHLNLKSAAIFNEGGEKISDFVLSPETILDEFRAGGRLNLIIGRSLTEKARTELKMSPSTVFKRIEKPIPDEKEGFSLGQKIAGQACGTKGVLPGSSCEPKMSTVGSQDTTGLMTADELKELACLEFNCDLFMQSFCHTAAYPNSTDVQMHQTLAQFIRERKGVVLKPGDGVIHSWINRLIMPDKMGTGGDSHTRFPIGLSFPAGSGLVAFAGALGFMPLDMPESVLVQFKGNLNKGITIRDVVNSIPYFAIKKGFLTVEKQDKKNVFNGRLIEMEGLPELSVEQAFELTDATAERSAAGGTIALSENTISNYVKSNIFLMKKLINDGYQNAEVLEKRIEECEQWLKNPVLLKRDNNARFAAELEIDLDEIKEPIVACPNDPDDVKLLSDVSGEKIDEIFIGSCMTNIGHFRAVGEIFEGQKYLDTRVWITPPTKMDRAQLRREGYYSVYSSIGARTEIPGCSLCMGNQARVRPSSTIISTSTRNFDNRMGDNARVYLGSAELAAIAAISGTLPEPDKYFSIMKEKILPKENEIYTYLRFDLMENMEFDY